MIRVTSLKSNMKTKVGFPTLGELVQFIYDAAGVLPRKRGLEDDIDETKKKTLQKALSRLANEEGDINENFGELIKNLAFLVTGHITNPRVNFSIGEVLIDVMEVYREVLKDDGTYLDKKGTMKWFLIDYAIGRLAFSVKKHMLRFNVAADNFSTPTDFWYLPTVAEGKIIFPLEKVMSWIYEECGRSQKSFHYPDVSNSANHVQQEQNWENAKNWMNGKSLPSLSALLWNFNSSINLVNNSENADAKISISSHLRDSFCITLFIARASTYMFKTALDSYGLPFAKEICEQFERQAYDVSVDFSEFQTYIENSLQNGRYTQISIDETWFHEIPQFCTEYANTQHQLSQFLGTKTPEEQAAIFQDSLEIENLIRYFGKFSVQSIAAMFNRTNSHEAPPNFINFLCDGLNLKNNRVASETEISLFELAMKESGTEPLLPWMLPWIQGAYHYRREEYDLAFHFLKDAFNSAKYCAGHHQYQLVNQFVEVSAKNDKRLEFKKGIRWAQYLGIEIRWLRKEEPTEENLDSVFAIMKKTVYASL